MPRKQPGICTQWIVGILPFLTCLTTKEASKLAKIVMVLASLNFVLTSCGEREMQQSHSPISKSSGNAKEEQGNRVFSVTAFGIPSTDFLLPYLTDTTADGGSHFWIYSVARNGDFCRALLFVAGPPPENAGCDAYCVTFGNGKKERILLTIEEAEKEIGFIEQVLVASGMKALYDSCYAEGYLRSENKDETEDGEPFGEDGGVGSAQDEDSANREIAKRTNEHTVCGIASVVRRFREANDRERLSPNNTGFQPSDPQPAKDKVSPTPEEFLPGDRRLEPPPLQESQVSDTPESDP